MDFNNRPNDVGSEFSGVGPAGVEMRNDIRDAAVRGSLSHHQVAELPVMAAAGKKTLLFGVVEFRVGHEELPEFGFQTVFE